MPQDSCCSDQDVGSIAKDENNNKSREKVFKKARRKIKMLFYWQTFGLVLGLSSVLSVQMLQTSINIKNQVGSISVTAGFLTSIFFCLFVCPTLLHTIGPTASLILSEACYLIYCLSNFYPELYVLVPGGIICGIGRALFVPSYTMLIIRLAHHCAEYSKSRQYNYYFDQFQSRFYCLNELVQIIGNGLSYAILYSTSRQSQDKVYANIKDNFTSANITADTDKYYQHCGANDCQELAVVQDNIDQYIPPNKASLYIFISVAALLAVFAIITHWVIYPGVGPFSEKLANIKTMVEKEVVLDHNSFNCKDSKDMVFLLSAKIKSSLLPDSFYVGLPNKNANPSDEMLGDREKYTISTSIDANDNMALCQQNNLLEKGDMEYVELKQREFKTESEKTSNRYRKTLKLTLLLFMTPRSLLLSVSTLHHGMMLGFVFADLTRAYASCVAGVQCTGAFAATFGVAGMISALAYGKLILYIGRHLMYCLSTLLELAVYAICYFWVPHNETLGTVFAMFIGIGIVNGLFRQNIIAAYTIHFPRSKSIALSVFNVWMMGGMGLQYAMTTFMCVQDKIYTQVAVTVAGFLFYAIAEVLRVRENKRRTFDIATTEQNKFSISC
ncbi:protein unc-93 homolog A-like [Styela clava]